VQLLDPFEIVLLGGTGDLAMRKLIPALYQRFIAGQFDTRVRIFGAASTAITRAQYVSRALEHCREHLAADEFNEARWNEFATCLDYQRVDATRAEDFKALKARIADRDSQLRVWFLSTSPSLYVATLPAHRQAPAADAGRNRHYF
jgi:glucose-6-phosphate 1-dehydrogenase